MTSVVPLCVLFLIGCMHHAHGVCGDVEGCGERVGDTEIHLLHLLQTRAVERVAKANIVQGHGKIFGAAEAPKLPIAWVHTPKTGTSFANVFFHHDGICPNMPADAFLDEEVFDQMKEFDLLHPIEAACPGGFYPDFIFEHNGIGDAWGRIGGEHVFMFFRKPEDRAISHFYYFQEPDVQAALQLLSPTPDVVPLAVSAQNASDFAKQTAGCFTRMLTRSGGDACMNGGEPTPDEVTKAVERTRKVAFVGITEEWDLSICLFYKMFGGKCNDHSFKDTRNGNSGSHDVEAELGGWTDPYDAPVYKAATYTFWERVEKYGVTREACKRFAVNCVLL